VPLQSDAVFQLMEERVRSQLDVQKSINALYLFDITVNDKNAAYWSKNYMQSCISNLYHEYKYSCLIKLHLLYVSVKHFLDYPCMGFLTHDASGLEQHVVIAYRQSVSVC